MWLALLQLALIAYVPGALIYRLPFAERQKRAALSAEERVFWGVMISVAVSSAVVIALAALEVYAFRALLAIDGLIAIGVAIAGNTRLLYRGTATRPTATALIPIAIVAAGLWLYFPAAEYIMGGKDPGSYVNEGIQIAQRGSLVTHDETVAKVPPPFRELFFPSYNNPYYFSSRFMGFFLIDAGEGTVLGQFPHLLPAWIAVGYGLDGLTGTRNVVAVWTILALVAIYLTGARLFGRAAAAAGTALVAINVIEVWFGRYPNAEILMQALLFGALLAWSRAQVDDDGFFAPVSATLLGLLLFLRFDAVLALSGVVVAAALGLATGRRPRTSFLVTLALWLTLASWYLFGLMKPYMEYPIGFISNLAIWQMIALVLGGLALVAFAVTASRLAPADTSPAATNIVRRVETWLPALITVVVLILATYAYFFRAEGGGIAIHDAMALRTFAWYVTPLGLAAALAGYVLAMQTTFRRDAVLLATITIFGLFFFYKIKIVPVHFWMARRFLPVLLPGAMLLVGYVAFEGLRVLTARLKLQPMPERLVCGTVGVVVVALLGMSFWSTSRPVLNHVEYSGIIPKLEALAQQFGDRDLVVVESRASGSELHVLALPLAYVYARQVLVLNTPRPDPIMFREFLSWARTQYDNVYFLGGGGTDLLTRTIGIVPVTSERFQVPEWESPTNALPRGARGKMFDLAVYRFVDAAGLQTNGNGGGAGTVLDVGAQDDVNVVRFHLKERDAHGVTYRWTQDASYISLVGIRAGNHELVLTLNDGHRPKTQPPCRVQVTLDDQVLGYVDVGRDFHTYTVPIPSTVAAAAAARETPARLKLAVTTWKPREVLGTPDDRLLGVMVDRVEVR